MILMLRHGQTDWNVEPARCQGWADVPLNEAGRAQARDQGRALRGRGLELIVTSHLARARETAEVVRAELMACPAAGQAAPSADPAAPSTAATATDPLPLVLDPRLAETDRGAWETRLFAEIVATEPEAWRHYREHPDTFRFPGGESLVEQQRRVLACLRDVALDGRRALLVTHGGSIRLVRCFLEGRGVSTFHQDATHNGVIDDVPARGLAQRIERFLLGNA
jgi:probable phosphoglycerate mutase